MSIGVKGKGDTAVSENLRKSLNVHSALECSGGEGMPQGVKTFPLQPCGVQDAVIPLAEVHRAGVVALLVWDQG